MAKSITFDTTLSAFGNNTGIELSPALIEQLDAGKRPAVVVNVNGHEYRTTVGVMRGRYLVGVSARIRDETGLRGGDAIHVVLTVADTPREVVVPEDFAAALAASSVARSFFENLSNSLQRYHVDQVSGAKAVETRQRRIQKAIGLFEAGKQR